MRTSQIPLENIILRGLSQGCAMGMYLTLTMDRLGGFVGMSGWLPFSGEVGVILDRDEDEGAVGKTSNLPLEALNFLRTNIDLPPPTPQHHPTKPPNPHPPSSRQS